MNKPPSAKTPAVFSVQPAEGAYALLRDGKAVSTPAGAPFVVPTAALAEALRAEEQTEGAKPKPDPRAMPMTQLAATAIDVVAVKPDMIVGNLLSYAEAELLCHRDDNQPQLAARQAEVWQPYLDWATQKFGVSFVHGGGLMPIAQPPATRHALHQHLQAQNVYFLTGLRQAVDLTGSLVLGLALAEGEREIGAILSAAELEQLFQSQKWGSDPVIEARHKDLARDLEDCRRWFNLLANVTA